MVQSPRDTPDIKASRPRHLALTLGDAAIEMSEQMERQLNDLIEAIRFVQSVSVKIHGVLDEAEIYATVAQEFAKSGRYAVAILLLTDNGSKLSLARTSTAPARLRAAERVSRLAVEGYNIDLNRSGLLSQVAREGKTVRATTTEVMDDLFGRPLGRVIATALGYEKETCILTPLYRHQGIMGVFAMTSARPVEEFIPSVEVLARHISTGVELAEERAKRRRAEELYRGLDESSGMAVIRLDREGRRTFVNDHATRIYGRSREDLLAGRYGDTILPEDRAGMERSFREAIEKGKLVFGSMSRQTVNGRVRYMSSNWMPIKDAQGNVLGMQTTTQDITDRVKMEEQLRQSEQLYREVVELTDAGVARFDLEGRRTFVNESLCNRHGRSTRELLEGTIGDQMVPQDQERLRELFHRCIESEKAVTGHTFRHEREGQTFYTRTNLTPIFGPDGKVNGVQVTSVDITDLVLAQEQLRRSEEQLRSVLDATGGMVIRVDREGRRTFVSGSALSVTGRTVEDYVRGEFGDIMVPEDREKAWALLRETFETGKPVRGFVTRQLVNGEPRYISANWEPIRDAGGNIVEVQTTSFDITDRLETEQLRARAEKFQAVASVASGLAHDINNILAGMSLWAEVANRHTRVREVKEAIENIQKGAQEGKGMLMRIRRFAQPAGMDGAVAVDVADLAAECIDFTRPLWKDHAELHDVHIELERDLKPVPPVKGNPTELREALVNLIQNAVEAMPEGGTLKVRTYSLAKEVCIAVSDTGVGIPSEEQEKIFNPYYTTKGREGSGLGLGVTYGIVSGHGGRIRVRSEVGKGSTFEIHLPVTG